MVIDRCLSTSARDNFSWKHNHPKFKSNLKEKDKLRLSLHISKIVTYVAYKRPINKLVNNNPIWWRWRTAGKVCNFTVCVSEAKWKPTNENQREESTALLLVVLFGFLSAENEKGFKSSIFFWGGIKTENTNHKNGY